MDGTARSSGAMDELSPQDRRRHARAGVMLMASLRSATGIFDCMVLDISRGGAKLMLTEPHELSPVVTLVLQGFGSFRAQQVWRHGEVVGIRFEDAPDTIAGAFPGIVP